MTFSFDLISDLHLETWPDRGFDWTGMATSQFALVAGDIAKDRAVVIKTLEHLARCYRMVFYIDGNEEHKQFMSDLSYSYRDLSKSLNRLHNVTYLQENVAVLGHVAILATNGWWSFDADPYIDVAQCEAWWHERMLITGYPSNADIVRELSRTDASYMLRSVEKLQRHQDVKHIVLMTHTVPRSDLIDHDLDLEGNYRFNCMTNSLMDAALLRDSERKIHTWCFGHYHSHVDRMLEGVRYVNNCRGRGDTEYRQPVYYPKRIEIV